MSALPEVTRSSAGSRSNAFHLMVFLMLSALPAAAATAFPPNALENQTFIALYVVTLPWSLGLCAVIAGFASGWFGRDERNQVFAAAGILLLSGAVGRAIAPGASVDEHFQGGSPLVVASEAIVFGLIGYALVYGWPMWCASFFVAAYGGWWVHEKRQPEDVVDVASRPALESPVVQASPSAPARVAIPAATSTLRPPMTSEPPRRPRHDELGGLTKAELYQRAREIGIKGRSAMSKAELLAALRANR